MWLQRNHIPLRRHALRERLQLETEHAYKALAAIPQQQAILNQQQALAVRQHILAQLSAQLAQLMQATEHVYSHQAQQALVARHQARATVAEHHQARATDLDQLIQVQHTLAVRLTVQPVQQMQVTEHVYNHLATALDQHIQVAMSQFIAEAQRQVVTHRRQRHHLQLTFQSGSKLTPINLKNPRNLRGFFYAYMTRAISE